MIQDWVNNDPRRILGGKSANEAIGIHLSSDSLRYKRA